MKILFTYALDAEKGEIIIPGIKTAFCCTGVGKVQAALAAYDAILEEKPDLVVNIGSAGTLNHNVGDILLCARFIDRDLEKVGIPGIVYELDFFYELSKTGFLMGCSINNTVSTGDSFVTDRAGAGPGADVVDMEAFGMAQACKKCHLPFISIKYVTDIIGQNSVKTWTDKLSDARIGLSAFIGTLKF